MTRTERLLRLARQRGDLLAIATLTAKRHRETFGLAYDRGRGRAVTWTEAELRAVWGDR